MVTYQQKQDKFFKRVEEEFNNGREMSKEYVLRDDYVNDNRICLTGVVFLPQELQEGIVNKIIEPLRKADKRQYYYLPESLQLTIQNARVVHNPPRFDERDIEKVRDVFASIIPRYKEFEFELKGLIELPTSIYIKGYCGQVLEDLVLELRKGLRDNGIVGDKKYPYTDVFIGSITLCRYRCQPNDRVTKEVQRLRNTDIGQLKVDKVSLVTTNFVARPEKTTIIEEFLLN